ELMFNALHEAFTPSLPPIPEPPVEVGIEMATNIQKPTPVAIVLARIQPGIGAICPNPFAAYLNSLHCRTAASENSLAESQAVNEFFGLIHVPHPLTNTISGK